MAMRRVTTTMDEDFAKMGLPVKTNDIVPIAGIKVDRNNDGSSELSEGAEDPGLSQGGGDDALDGEYVTKELFDRIEGLPFDKMDESDCDELIDELGKKKLPEGDAGLVEQAERVVLKIKEIKEAAAKRQRRFKAGGVARKVSFQCPQGKRAVSVGGGGGRPKCVPAHKAAGSVGKLNKEAIKKKKRSRSGKGLKTKRKGARLDPRRAPMRREDTMSPLAMELMQVAESVEENSMVGIRDDIVDRVMTIMELLNEEFCDASVTEIYTESVNNVMELYDAGRLDEDTMDENEFISELQPMLKLITTSVARLEEAEELGNV